MGAPEYRPDLALRRETVFSSGYEKFRLRDGAMKLGFITIVVLATLRLMLQTSLKRNR
jgi:hypothetical protein